MSNCTLSSQSWLMARFPGLRSYKCPCEKSNYDCESVTERQKETKTRVTVVHWEGFVNRKHQLYLKMFERHIYLRYTV